MTCCWTAGINGKENDSTSTMRAVPVQVIPPWLNHWFLKSSSCCRPLAVRFELTGKSQRVSLGFALWARSRYSYLCQSSCRPCRALFVDTVIRRAPSAQPGWVVQRMWSEWENMLAPVYQVLHRLSSRVLRVDCHRAWKANVGTFRFVCLPKLKTLNHTISISSA